jgi:hypothetical protein
MFRRSRGEEATAMGEEATGEEATGEEATGEEARGRGSERERRRLEMLGLV